MNIALFASSHTVLLESLIIYINHLSYVVDCVTRELMINEHFKGKSHCTKLCTKLEKLIFVKLIRQRL